MRRLSLSADRAGCDVVLDITTKFRPPEPSLQECDGPANPWVAGQIGGMGPLQHLGSDLDGDEESIVRARAGRGPVGQGNFYQSFDIQFNSVDENFGAQNGVGNGIPGRRVESARQGVRFDILGPGTVG